MGNVWLAQRNDGRFEGRAAVKLLNASLLGRAGEERFRREGDLLARLAEPHIARLLDAGVSPRASPISSSNMSRVSPSTGTATPASSTSTPGFASFWRCSKPSRTRTPT